MQKYVPGPRPRRRRFAVTVDGVRHEVIVEELDETPGEAAAESASSPADEDRAQAATPANDLPDAEAPTDGWVDAPMPGTVTEISVQVGDAVKAGDVLLILTAMKLENEITAPAAGTVKTVAVSEGDNVNNGDRLIELGTGGTDE